MVSNSKSDKITKMEPSVRFIREGVQTLTNNPRQVIGVLFAGLIIAALANTFYRVDIGNMGILQRFGHLIEAENRPGLHIRIPYGVDTVTILPTERNQRLPIFEQGQTNIEVITGDANITLIDIIVQYQIRSPSLYLFASETPTLILKHAARATLIKQVANKPIDWVLGLGKTKLSTSIRDATQRYVNDLGIIVLSVNIRSVNPPTEAIASFRDVNDARTESVRYQNMARAR